MSTAQQWKRTEGRTQPPFIGLLVTRGVVVRRTVISYTTLDAAIWAAEGEGFNRITNDQGLCAYTSGGKPKP